MKKLIMLTMVILGLLISGCAGNKMWMKDGATQEQFEQDKRECLYEAEKFTAPMNSPYRGLSGAIATGITDGLQEGLRKISLFKQCMECRGYFLADQLSQPNIYQKTSKRFIGSLPPNPQDKNCYWELDKTNWNVGSGLKRPPEDLLEWYLLCR